MKLEFKNLNPKVKIQSRESKLIGKAADRIPEFNEVHLRRENERV